MLKFRKINLKFNYFSIIVKLSSEILSLNIVVIINIFTEKIFQSGRNECEQLIFICTNIYLASFLFAAQ